MSSLKYYIADYNGMLTDLKKRLSGQLATPRDADVWIVWQDCRGSYQDLIQESKKYFPKPVFCVQHGRNSTFDYGPPNKFPFLSDMYLCWGKSDYEKMLGLGFSKDRLAITGCPLNQSIKPRVKHNEKVVLFVPINTGKEEPENIAVYYELLKIKYEKAQTKVMEYREKLKDTWGFDGRVNVHFNELADNIDVVAKLLPWHDKSLYHGNIVAGHQDTSKNNKLVFDLLQNVDAVVGLDEGTTEVFAYGHDVPVVIVEGFQYRQYKYNGRDYETIGSYQTKAAIHCSIDNLKEALFSTIKYPENYREERKEVAELELGLSYGDATTNIIKEVKTFMKRKHEA